MVKNYLRKLLDFRIHSDREICGIQKDSKSTKYKHNKKLHILNQISVFEICLKISAEKDEFHSPYA